MTSLSVGEPAAAGLRRGVGPNLKLELHRLPVLRRQYLGLRMETSQRFGKSQRLGFLPMNHRDFLDLSGQIPDVLQQFVLVGMSGERIDRRHARPHLVRFPEDIDRRPSRKNLRSQRVLGAVTDKKNQVVR